VLSGFALLANVVGDSAAPGPPASGLPDLIVGHDVESPASSQGAIWIYPNPGDGLFAAGAQDVQRIELGANSRPKSAIAADLDADGDLDLAVVTVGRRRTGQGPTGSLIVLRNDQGILNIQQTLTVSDEAGSWPVDGPIDLVATDWDQDGILDLATVDFRSHTVSLLQGRGQGHFEVSRVLPSSDRTPRAIEAADLDGNGTIELIVGYYDSNSVVVLQASQPGEYVVAQRLTANRPTDVVAADVDGDQLPELLVAGDDGVSVLWNANAAPFGERSELLFDMRAQSVALGDVNGDQVADLLVAHPDDARVSVLLYLGQRDFASPASFFVPSPNSSVSAAPQTIAVADVDGDQDLDLATGLAVGGASVLLNRLGEYVVDVTYGQTEENLDFGNHFAGVALVAQLAGASRDEAERTTLTPLATTRELAAAAADARFDVSGDGHLSPLDALLIVNELNRDLAPTSAQPLAARDTVFDINGDGSVSPLDALLVINRLNISLTSALDDIAAALDDGPDARLADAIFADSAE
jgi:hypothetical protein